MDSYALFEFIEETSASLGRGVRVLDAGAGECQYRDLFSDVRYVGVDLAVGEPEWDYRCLDAFSDVTALPFAAQTFDAVLCFQVLEHLPEPLQALCEFRRVMSPGGRLFLSTPQSWHQHQKPHDYFRYTSFGLRYLMQKAGLDVLSMKPMGGYFWFLAFQLQNMNYWLFPRGMKGRRWTLPLRVANAVLFQLLLSLTLYYFDRFDRTKDETFGYVCVATRPHSA